MEELRQNHDKTKQRSVKSIIRTTEVDYRRSLIHYKINIAIFLLLGWATGY